MIERSSSWIQGLTADGCGVCAGAAAAGEPRTISAAAARTERRRLIELNMARSAPPRAGRLAPLARSSSPRVSRTSARGVRPSRSLRHTTSAPASEHLSPPTACANGWNRRPKRAGLVEKQDCPPPYWLSPRASVEASTRLLPPRQRGSLGLRVGLRQASVTRPSSEEAPLLYGTVRWSGSRFRHGLAIIVGVLHRQRDVEA